MLSWYDIQAKCVISRLNTNFQHFHFVIIFSKKYEKCRNFGKYDKDLVVVSEDSSKLVESRSELP